MSAPPRERILVSACLLGQPVRYDGRGAACGHALLARWRAEGRLLTLCPESAGGLPTPRPPAEIQGQGGGAAVLRERARVLDAGGSDVSAAFRAGAAQALALARAHGLRLALLKENSPSCGSTWIYDGGFVGRLQPGQGVTAALLREAGIEVFGESQLEALAARLVALEAGG